MPRQTDTERLIQNDSDSDYGEQLARILGILYFAFCELFTLLLIYENKYELTALLWSHYYNFLTFCNLNSHECLHLHLPSTGLLRSETRIFA